MINEYVSLLHDYASKNKKSCCAVLPKNKENKKQIESKQKFPYSNTYITFKKGIY